MGEKGQPLNTVENLAYLLGEYGISVRYNITRKMVEVKIPGKDYGDDLDANCTITEISSLCARNRMPKADAENYIKLISSWDRHNPVQEFIESRPWDGTSRLADLYATLQTPEGYDRTLLEMLVRRWLVSAAAAALQPRGFWSKGVLVLQGGQSEGKTSWFKSLLPVDLRKLLKVGATIDPANKDSVASVISHWMVELGELDATFRKADIARLKSFISQDIDQLRRPYDRLESEYQRRTVFFASVNPKVFLVDDTGNVRWWTIPVAAVDPDHSIDTQQLWAEVAHLYAQGERWWLTKGEESLLEVTNQDHQAPNSIKELIQSRFDWSGEREKLMSATEVLVAIGYDKPTNPQAKDAGQALRELTGEEPRKSNGRMVFRMPSMFRHEQRQMFGHQVESRPF
jgi:putative DNA primase/helicase